MRQSKLMNFAKGGELNTAKIKVLELRNNVPYLVMERPSSENLTICVCANSEQQKQFPDDGVVLFVPDLADAMALFEI